MLTPYEFGRETGRLQAQVHTEISEERIEHLAHILGIEEKVSFSEGYRNGFTASRKLAEELGDIEPSDEELDAIEKDPRLLLKNYELGEDGHLEYTGDEIDDQGRLAAEAAFDEELDEDEADLKAAIAHGRQLVNENLGYKYY